MTTIKTFKGLTGILHRIVQVDATSLKGYDNLQDEDKRELSFIIGELNDALSQVISISERLNEVKSSKAHPHNNN